MTAYDLLVVGAGITGLAAAWEASEAGASVLVLDPAQQVGGKVSTERVDGLVIERGPDAFVAYRPAALDLVDELGLGGEVVGVGPDRTVHIRSGGRLRPIPEGMGLGVPTRLGPFLRTHLLSPWDKARAALDLLLPRRLPDEDVAVGPFLRARLGNGVVDRLAQPLVGGVYGAGVDELSLDAVLPNLREDERGHRSLLLAGLSQGRARRAAAGTPSDSAPGATSPFRSLRRGLGSLPEALQAALLERGATAARRSASAQRQPPSRRARRAPRCGMARCRPSEWVRWSWPRERIRARNSLRGERPTLLRRCARSPTGRAPSSPSPGRRTRSTSHRSATAGSRPTLRR